MRALLITFAAASAAAALGQFSGTYAAKEGAPQQWSINANHTLIWGGTPYMPVGLRIDGSPEEVARAKAAGFQDVIVDLPAGGTNWSATLKALEASNMRYLVSISSLAPMAEGVAVEPAGYRIVGLTKPQKLNITLPGSSSTLIVVVNRRDASVASVSRQPVINGQLTIDVKPIAELEQVVLLYPRMRSLQQIDLWDALDEHRDRLLTTLRSHANGPGLRGIVNPLGRLATWERADPRFVPTSPYFRYEFASYLKQKYKTVETAMKAWSMATANIDSFEQLARLAPLWSGPSRGIPQLWDTDSDKLFTCNNARSLVWTDIQDAITGAAVRRYQRFVSAIQTVAQVPVVQEWAGWSPMYEAPSPAISGIGMRAVGTSPSALLQSGSRATSSLLRWTRPGWLVATDVEPGSDDAAASQLSNVLDDLSSLGARGWFLRSTKDSVMKAMAAQAARANDGSLAQYSPQALYYPESAFNPAVPQQLPGGRWWLPSPASGNRIDLGSNYYAYRYNDGVQSYTALWSSLPAARVKLRLLDTKSPTFSSLDGTSPEPKIKKDGIEVSVGPIPLIIAGTDEVPIPEPAYVETMSKVNQLIAMAEKNRVDMTEYAYLFRDALSAFERSPGGAFPEMRREYGRITSRLALYSWIEAETSKDNNFSEVMQSAGCSGGAALALRTQLASPADGYYSEYSLPVRTQLDSELWIAARIPADQRQNVVVNLAGQNFTIQGEPVSLYGQGFGWYRLGVTKLGGRQTKLRLSVIGGSADLAFDTFVIYPGSFQPKGVAIPDAIVFATGPVKKGG